MKSILKTLAIVLAIIISGCSKDDDGNQQPEQNLRLKSHSENTLDYNFNYNDDGSLKSYQRGSNTTNIIYDAEGRIKQQGTTIFTYNDQGRISEITNSTFQSNIVYNNEGLIAYFSSSYSTLGTTTTTFEYDINNRLISVLEEASDPIEFKRTTLTYDANDNIEQKLVERSSDGVLYEQDYVVNYTYDSKENPFYTTLKKTGIDSNISVVFLNGVSASIGNNIAFGKLYYYSKNNIMSISNSSGSTKIYEYVYDDNNFPISAEMERTYSPDPSLNYTVYSTWNYETY